MAWFIRNTVFSFFGGYALTSFYNDSVRLGKLSGEKNGRKINWWGRNEPPATFSQDVRQTIIENETICALALALFVVSGGLSAMSGAIASFVLEGPDGPDRYKEVRTTYRKAIAGELS